MSTLYDQIRWEGEKPENFSKPFFVKVNAYRNDRDLSVWQSLKDKVILVVAYAEDGKYSHLCSSDYQILPHPFNDTIKDDWPPHYFENAHCIAKRLCTLYVENNEQATISLKEEFDWTS